MTRLDRVATRALIGLATLALAAACGSGGDDAAPSPSTDAAAEPTAITTGPEPAAAAGTPDEGCGVTLAEVQALLPGGSGVTQNDTPDARRCNFTWDDGGPRGIDVAFVDDGGSSFVPPPGWEPIEGYGDEAYASTDARMASAVAIVGDDLYAVDVSATNPSEDLADLAVGLLELAVS
jgi:hypothetical protein